MSLPAELIRFLSELTLAGGDHDGQPFTVLPWERHFVRGAFGRPSHAALSVLEGKRQVRARGRYRCGGGGPGRTAAWPAPGGGLCRLEL